MVRRFLVAVSALLVFLTMLPGTSARAAIDPTASEIGFLQLLNAARAQNGLGSLQADAALKTVARDWSGQMAATFSRTQTVIDAADPGNCNKSALCHRPNLREAIDGAVDGWTSAGENVGTGGTVQVLHDAFVASPGHYANIMGRYNRVGIGAVFQNDRIWVTFNFVLGPALPPQPETGENSLFAAGLKPSAVVTALGLPTAYQPVSPRRIVDTRSGLGGVGPLTAGGIFRISLNSEAGRPAATSGVVLNLTATQPSGPGFITAFPCGNAPPLASNINVTADQTVPNLVASALGADNTVCVFSTTSVHLIADLAGWLTTGNDGALQASSPFRLLDSRSGGVKGQVFTVSLRGRVPADSSAVSLNLTVTEPNSTGYLTAFACGSPQPVVSNGNFTAGKTRPNMAIVPLGTNQTVCFYSPVPVHLIVDHTGWISAGPAVIQPVAPTRLLDTRDGTGEWLGRLGAGQTIDIDLNKVVGLPSGVSAVQLNLTAADGAATGFASVFPCGSSVPLASSINYERSDTRANMALVDVSDNGHICLYSSQRVHLLADLAAYLLGTP